MTPPENVFESDLPAGEEPAPEESGLYRGDSGELPLEARQVFVKLLSGPYIDSEQHPKIWPVLLRFEAQLRSRLADLFLELVLDVDAGVAFTRQADTGDLDTPILLGKSTLTFVETVLLLYLREKLMEADVRGERATVGAVEIREQLSLYERAANTDRAGYTRKVNNAIEKMKQKNVLRKLRASEDRFEVSPTLRLLFSAEEVRGLAVQYRKLLPEEGESR